MIAGREYQTMANLSVTLYNAGEGIIGFIIIIGNGIVLVAIFKYRHLHTPTNVFIGHLAAADIMTGVLVAPLAIITSLDLDMNFPSCILLNTVLVLFANASIFMLFCVTCERYAAIRYPFKYNDILDVPLANYIAVTAWVVGFVTGLMPMFGWNKGAENYGSKCSFLAVICHNFLVYFQFVFMFLVPIVLMTCVYAYIGRIARRNRRGSLSIYARFNVKMLSHVRTAKSFVVLIVVMFVLKLPLHLLNCMTYYDVTRPWSAATEGKITLILILLSRSNSMVNPFIYAASHSKMKAAMLNVALRRPITCKDRESTLSSITPVAIKIKDIERSTNTADFKNKEVVCKSNCITPIQYSSINSHTSQVESRGIGNNDEGNSCSFIREM